MSKESEAKQRYLDQFPERQALRMALPAWLRLLNLFLNLSFIFALTAALTDAFFHLHHLMHPTITIKEMYRLDSGALMFILAFFGSVTPGLMLANLLMYAIAPLRRLFEENAKQKPSVTDRTSMLDYMSQLPGPSRASFGLVLALLPPPPSALDPDNQGVPDLSFRDAMRDLVAAATYTVPPALLLGLIAAVEPWVS